MAINKNLLAIKAHYFLRYAASAPLTMLLPLMVLQKGVSAQGIGLLWTLLPLVGIITSSISGTLADYLKAHRQVFIASLVFLTVGLSSVYWIPSLPLTEGVSVHLHPSPNAGDPKVILLNGTNDHNEMLRDTNTANSSLKDNDYIIKIDPEMVVDEGQAPPPDPRVTSGNNTLVTVLVQYPQFWLIFFAVMVEQMGLSTCVMISDAVCFKILGSERHLYGRQRLWGTIGMGGMAIGAGGLVDLYSRGLPHTDYLPVVLICLVLMSVDIVVVAKMNIPSTQEERMRMGDVKSNLYKPQVFLFLVTVFVIGTSLGLLWVFKMMHIEDVALIWDPNFAFLKFLQGLDIGIETFGGELPFFFLSGLIIQRLGHTLVMATSLVSLGIRFCLYYGVTNPWWFLPIELLNGLSFSLYHTAMASYASYIAPPGAQATLQAVVRAIHSAGLSVAGFLGGTLFQTLGGAHTFLTIGCFDFGYVIVFGLLHFLIMKSCNRRKILGDSTPSPPSAQDSSTTSSGSIPPTKKSLKISV